MMTPQSQTIQAAFENWYSNLQTFAGVPAKGTIAGALVVLDRLRKNFDLSIEAHTARGGAQIVGVSGAAVQQVLKSFGEERPFLSEGGRTNRGLRGDMMQLLYTLQQSGLAELPADQRDQALQSLQIFLVERVKDYHNRSRLEIVFDPSETLWQSVRDLLDLARLRGVDGPVAEYLVGAKLQLRFPNHDVRNESFSTADVQQHQPGDFLVGDTAFHVTVAPGLSLIEKCMRNLQEGYKVYLLVPDATEQTTRLSVDSAVHGKISVASIESFVAQNIDEIAAFDKETLNARFRELLETYNVRVDQVENDKSLLIKIPQNL